MTSPSFSLYMSLKYLSFTISNNYNSSFLFLIIIALHKFSSSILYTPFCKANNLSNQWRTNHYVFLQDYMASIHSLTLNTQTSICIFSLLFSIHFSRCWQEEFVQWSRASLVDDHLLYSRDLNVWSRGNIVRRI